VPDERERRILDVIRALRTGEVTTYGDVAEIAGYPKRSRLVGHILATTDVEVPWWRVVNAGGNPPPRHVTRALTHLRDEGTPLSADGTRVALRQAIWFPDDD